jgi:hypothetical protein
MNPIKKSKSKTNNKAKQSPSAQLSLAAFRRQHAKYNISFANFNTTRLKEYTAILETYPKGVYCSPIPISSAVPIDTYVFIMEVHYNARKITAIGLIKNHPVSRQTHYNKQNLNRYTYYGKYRIPVEEMTPAELQIVRLFESWCFYGKYSNFKKLVILNHKTLYRIYQYIDVLEVLRNMFKERM